MSQMTKALNTLRAYFKTKGRVLNAQEYARETDTPIRIQIVRNLFGSWNRLEKLLMVDNSTIAFSDVDSVIESRNKAAAELEAQWREASENQDAKAAREAAAQALGEKLALNAATAAGANANKIAIGGPLPQEQGKLESHGATVNIHPKTGERTVVDPDPELVDAATGTGKTPAELVAAAKDNLDTGNVATGSATDGGSQGSPSIATVQALGGANDAPTVDLTPKETVVVEKK